MTVNHLLNQKTEPPLFGLAYCPSARRLISKYPSVIDYLEVPFELLAHNPSVEQDIFGKRVILHCASLSLAGVVDPKPSVIDQVVQWVNKTNTPWLGEHLAYLLAEQITLPDEDCSNVDPYNIGFTVSPPMNLCSVNNTAQRIRFFQSQLDIPLLIENSPIYFKMPGSDMSQITFINSILEQCDAGLLLDLTHLVISSLNEGFSACEALLSLPIERIVEIHVSGISTSDGITWDHHASNIPGEVLALLSLVSHSPSLRAVTLEYNWISGYSDEAVAEQLMIVRDTVLNTP